ncbi:DUF5719 family protein [Demequina sp.]|uniref:DUF5719 family protein n=1 Tax=Demequina sp. TaxID=2050685 RepID=UPI0025C70BFC|nr:DUF5719 family protein [Demequina sp.]
MIRRIVVSAGALAVVTASAAATIIVASPPLEMPTPMSFEIEPPAPVVACPGGQTVPVGDVGTGGDLASEPTVRTLDVWGPTSTRAVGLGLGADDAIAVQTERIADGDIEGWAALTCAQPSFDQWLVGGATTLGSSTRLVLSNPSTAPTEVTVTIYGPLGAREDQVLLPIAPGDSVQRLIEGVATQMSAIVLRVEATGPGVVAALQDSRLEGFQPAGTTWVGASAPATDSAIPVVNADAQAVRNDDAASGNTDTGSATPAVAIPGPAVTVRLMAPDGARVELSLVSPEGIESWSVGQAITLDPGVVTDIDVPTDRLGAIEVRSDEPVLASARTVVARAPREGLAADVAYDHTWVPAMDVRTPTTLSAVVPSDGARLAVYSPVAAQVEVLGDADEVVGSADIAARTVQWVPITAAQGARIHIEGVSAWAFVMTSPDGYIASAAPVDISTTFLTATVLPDTYPASGGG